MQSVYTALVGRGGMLHKLYVPDEAVEGLYAAARETGLRFHARARETLAAFADGSLLLINSPDRAGAPLTAAVRSPARLGTVGAWREVAIAGAIAYRVGPGGIVVAVVPADEGGAKFDLVLDRGPGEAPVEIARAQPVEGGLGEVWFTRDGRILIRRHSLGGDEAQLVVTTSAGLAPDSAE